MENSQRDKLRQIKERRRDLRDVPVTSHIPALPRHSRSTRQSHALRSVSSKREEEQKRRTAA
jgi:hypothetical protein